jgi:hypothetical protein
MSHAVFTFGRFNPPTESGHGKLVQSVKDHAEKVGGQHYIFPSHSVDKKSNPLSHKDKVHAMKKLFPNTNIVSNEGLRHTIHVMKHLNNQGHDKATMVVGSDRVGEFHKLLHKYNGKEYNFKKISVKSAGHRDPDAEGSEGMSASKLRGLAQAGKRDEFISHYSDSKIGAHIHDKVKKAMNESKQAMFVLGGPGSGKDYVITNILNRFNLVEVQIDQILNGSVQNLIEAGCHFLINGNTDVDKIQLVKSILGEDYDFAHTIVSVSNKASRQRNEMRNKPLNEQVRIRKWLDAERLANQFENVFVFKNSLNLNEASQSELKEFRTQIANYLGFLTEENDYAWKTEVTIHKPGHKLHGQKATVFHKHDDGRMNVQVRRGFRDVDNFTLKKDEYKDFKKKDFGQTPEQKKKYAALKKAAKEGKLKYGKQNEVLEWGTDETVSSYKEATPGEKAPAKVSIKKPSTANVKPQLNLRKLKSRLKTPPDAYDSRVGGVQPAGGLNQGGSYSTIGPIGGLS